MSARVLVQAGRLVPPEAQAYDSEAYTAWLRTVPRTARSEARATPVLMPAAVNVPRAWTVTCVVELRTFEVMAVEVERCPRCGSSLIRVWSGPLSTIYGDPGGEPFEAWLRTRFACGFWEAPALEAASVGPAPERVTLLDDSEESLARRIGESPLLVDALTRLAERDRAAALFVLDGIFAAQLVLPPTRRQAERYQALAQFFQQGGVVAGLSLAEREYPDLFDAAAVIGAEQAARYARLALVN